MGACSSKTKKSGSGRLEIKKNSSIIIIPKAQIKVPKLKNLEDNQLYLRRRKLRSGSVECKEDTTK